MEQGMVRYERDLSDHLQKNEENEYMILFKFNTHSIEQWTMIER
jgi:hypothetical protein